MEVLVGCFPRKNLITKMFIRTSLRNILVITISIVNNIQAWASNGKHFKKLTVNLIFFNSVKLKVTYMKIFN